MSDASADVQESLGQQSTNETTTERDSRTNEICGAASQRAKRTKERAERGKQGRCGTVSGIRQYLAVNRVPRDERM